MIPHLLILSNVLHPLFPHLNHKFLHPSWKVEKENVSQSQTGTEKSEQNLPKSTITLAAFPVIDYSLAHLVDIIHFLLSCQQNKDRRSPIRMFSNIVL